MNLPEFLEAVELKEAEEKIKKKDPPEKKSPREDLLGLVTELVASAAASGNKTIDSRSMKRLCKQFTESVDAEASRLTQRWLAGLKKMAQKMVADDMEATPERATSATVVTPGSEVAATNLQSVLEEEEGLIWMSRRRQQRISWL